MLVQHLADLLGHADVSLQPVRDLNDRIRINGYEQPDRLRDHTWQLAGGDVFPYAPSGTRLTVDYDHPTPYDRNGPPGQTGTHNSGPLRRTHHRGRPSAATSADNPGRGDTSGEHLGVATTSATTPAPIPSTPIVPR